MNEVYKIMKNINIYDKKISKFLGKGIAY